jgi:hypothetical protein
MRNQGPEAKPMPWKLPWTLDDTPNSLSRRGGSDLDLGISRVFAAAASAAADVDPQQIPLGHTHDESFSIRRAWRRCVQRYRWSSRRSGWTAPAGSVITARHRWKLIGNAVNVRTARWLGSRLARPAEAYWHGGEPLLKGSAWPLAAWNVGLGRFSSPVSPWPRQRKFQPIHEFLRDPVSLLSARATAGFLSRLLASNLRADERFIHALRAHLRRVSSGAFVDTNGGRRSPRSR